MLETANIHLVIDGYNVMHALPVEREWGGREFQDRRRSFLDRLVAYAAGRPHRITVVFDGAKGGDELGGAERHGDLEVVYSPRGVEADDVIRRLLDGSPRPGIVLLVTSDRSLADYARHRGASTARSDELIGRLFAGTRGTRGGDAAAFEARVKGYRPERRPRSAPRSRSPLTLW